MGTPERGNSGWQGIPQVSDVSFPPQVPEKYHYNCTITDALRGLTHVVQIRMQEEFGIGQWSQWSPEVRGTPWTGTGGCGREYLFMLLAVAANDSHVKGRLASQFSGQLWSCFKLS